MQSCCVCLLVSIEEATADVSTDKLDPLQLSDIWTLLHSSQKYHSSSQKANRAACKNIKPFIRSYSINGIIIYFFYMIIESLDGIQNIINLICANCSYLSEKSSISLKSNKICLINEHFNLFD